MDLPLLPPDHNIMRYVSPSKLRKDENGVVHGVLYEAFLLRSSEVGLSVTWLEYFSGSRTQQELAAAHATRASVRTKPKSAFAVGSVGQFLAICEERSYVVHIVHSRTGNNEAHAEVLEMPRDDTELLEIIARSWCRRLILNSDIPAAQ
jgi:hypothetical protein